MANCPVCGTAYTVRYEYPCGAEMGPHYDPPKEVPGYVIDITSGFSDWDGPTQLALPANQLPPLGTIWVFDDGCCAYWTEPEPWDEEIWCPKCEKTEDELETS